MAELKNYDLPELTLPQQLRERARMQGSRIALVQKRYGIWNPLTWDGYYSRACHFGLGLRALGLPDGGRVGILSDSRQEWVLAQMGAGLVGALVVGVYSTSPTAEVAYVLGHADVDMVVCEDQEQTDKVLAALGQLPRLTRVVVMDRKGLQATGTPGDRKVISFAEVEALGVEYEVTHRSLVEDTLARQRLEDIALLVYTSGSTGKPKGAMISYANIRAATRGMVERLDLSAATRQLSYLPLSHVAEQIFTTFVPIYCGSQVNFGESLRTVQEDLREVAPSIFLGVPRIWEKLHTAIHNKMLETGAVRRALYRGALRACAPFAFKAAWKRSLWEKLVYTCCYWLIFRSLQNFVGLRHASVVLSGAASIAPAIFRYFRTIGLPLVEFYGLTETCAIVSGQSLDAVRPGSVGKTAIGLEHRIGPQGELLLRGDLVFAGYYKDPENTAVALRDGWLHTGDVAREEDGHLFIVDRLKDIMITAGGKNLTPSEIENKMKASPYITECIVIAEGRKYVGALVQLDFETTARWAETQRLAYTNYRSLAEHPRVRELIAIEIERGNSELARVAHIRKFHLLPKELDHDDGEVTATMKVRRASITKTYRHEIEGLFIAEPESAVPL